MDVFLFARKQKSEISGNLPVFGGGRWEDCAEAGWSRNLISEMAPPFFNWRRSRNYHESFFNKTGLHSMFVLIFSTCSLNKTPWCLARGKYPVNIR